MSIHTQNLLNSNDSKNVLIPIPENFSLTVPNLVPLVLKIWEDYDTMSRHPLFMGEKSNIESDKGDIAQTFIQDQRVHQLLKQFLQSVGEASTQCSLIETTLKQEMYAPSTDQLRWGSGEIIYRCTSQSGSTDVVVSPQSRYFSIENPSQKRDVSCHGFGYCGSENDKLLYHMRINPENGKCSESLIRESDHFNTDFVLNPQKSRYFDVYQSNADCTNGLEIDHIFFDADAWEEVSDTSGLGFMFRIAKIAAIFSCIVASGVGIAAAGLGCVPLLKHYSRTSPDLKPFSNSTDTSPIFLENTEPQLKETPKEEKDQSLLQKIDPNQKIFKAASVSMAVSGLFALGIGLISWARIYTCNASANCYAFPNGRMFHRI